MTAARQPAFVGGEISPSLYARTDLARYGHSLALCKNWIVQREGGLANRPGTRFLAEVKDSAKTVRLVPFVFAQGQALVLEFGNLYIRFFMQDPATGVSGPVLATGAPAWVGATPYATGAYVTMGGLTFRSLADANLGHSPATSPTWWVAAPVYEVPTPYLEADLPRLKFTQINDVVLIVHASYAPRELRRSSNTNWTLTTWAVGRALVPPTALDIANDLVSVTRGPRMDTADESHPWKVWDWVVTAVDEHGNESLPSAPISLDRSMTGWPNPPAHIPVLYPDRNPAILTWSGVTGAVRYNVYRGRNEVYGFVGSSTGTRFDDEALAPAYGIAPPSGRDPFAGAGNYPSAAAYFQQRLVFAGSLNNPQTLYFSKPGEYKNFDETIPSQEDDAIELTLASTRMDEIRSLACFRALMVFTGQAGYSVQGAGGGALTPSSFDIRPEGYRRAAWLDPILNGHLGLVLDDAESRVVEIGYSQESDGYLGRDVSVFAAHLLEGHQIVSWAFASVPYSTAWAVREDGVLLGFTRLAEQEVAAWHRHETDGFFESVATIPEAGEDGVYVVVRRTVSGQTKRYVERLASRQAGELDIRRACHLDSSLEYDGRITDGSTITVGGSIGLVVRATSAQMGGLARLQGPFLEPEKAFDGLGTATFASSAQTQLKGSSIVLAFPQGDPYPSIRGRMYVDPNNGTVAAPVQLRYSLNAGVTWTTFASLVPGPAAWYETPLLSNVDPGRFQLSMFCPRATITTPDRLYDAVLVNYSNCVTSDDSVFLTCSVSKFSEDDVGDEVWIDAPSGRVRIQITGYSDATTVVGATITSVPASLIGVPATSWAIARSALYGLDHLNGLTVGILADGNVEAPAMIDGGILELHAPAVIVQAGLPYVSEARGLPLWSLRESIREKRKTITALSLEVIGARGLWAGTRIDRLTEWKQRVPGEAFEPLSLKTGVVKITVGSSWSEDEAAIVQQVDPVPATLLALIAEVNVGA